MEGPSDSLAPSSGSTASRSTKGERAMLLGRQAFPKFHNTFAITSNTTNSNPIRITIRGPSGRLVGPITSHALLLYSWMPCSHYWGLKNHWGPPWNGIYTLGVIAVGTICKHLLLAAVFHLRFGFDEGYRNNRTTRLGRYGINLISCLQIVYL